MRFNYLTATMLREAACLIEQGECACICWAIEKIEGEHFGPARKEFERLLEEMNVSKNGWLDYQLGDRTIETDRKQSWCSQEQRVARAFFLHMLADAIAYKAPKRQKFDGSNKPFSENPSEPGVYAVVLRNSNIPHVIMNIYHFSKWDGSKWCITTDSVKCALMHSTKSPTIHNRNPLWNNYSHWINTKLD